MTEVPMLEVQNITKRFKGLTAVKNVSFSIKQGGITGMIGPLGLCQYVGRRLRRYRRHHPLYPLCRKTAAREILIHEYNK